MKMGVFLIFLTALFFIIRFYHDKIMPHSHYVEVTLAYITVGIIVCLFIVILFVPKERKIILRILVTLFSLIFIFAVNVWGVRPYQMIYIEVPKRIEMLHAYLEETNPNRSWEIRKDESTFSSRYHMLVTFEDEPDITYGYLMSDDVVNGKEEIKVTSTIE